MSIDWVMNKMTTFLNQPRSKNETIIMILKQDDKIEPPMTEVTGFSGRPLPLKR